jgi:hypothetical protein
VQNLTTQKVLIALVTLAFFIAAPYLISEVLGGNTAPLAALLGLGALLLFVFALGEKCWLSIPLCLPMGGSLNILPVKFSPHELSILLVIGYVFVQFVMTNRRSLTFGPAYIWAPILVIATILIYHWGKGGNIGIASFGSSSAGARKTFTILCGMLSLPAILWFKSPGDRWLRCVPLLYLIGCLLDFIPYLASSLAPSIAPSIFRVYSGVNIEAFSSTIAGRESDIVRIGSLGNLSLSIQLVLLSYFRPKEWVRPSRFFVPIISILALIGCIFSGFRSYLFNYLVASFAALFFSVRWTALLIFPVVALFISTLVLGQGSAFELPLTIQRTLSMFPGKWSRLASSSTESSNDFRANIEKTYREEFMEKSGMLGDGFKYDSRIMLDTALSFYTRNIMNDNLSESRGYITQRDHHVGWVAVHHPIGTIGFVAFVFLCLGSVYYVTSRILFLSPVSILPQQIWTSSLVVQTILSFFTVFGAMQQFIPQLCILLAIAIVSFRPPESQLPTKSAQHPAQSFA